MPSVLLAADQHAPAALAKSIKRGVAVMIWPLLVLVALTDTVPWTLRAPLITPQLTVHPDASVAPFGAGLGAALPIVNA
jgi:hypothetical protein